MKIVKRVLVCITAFIVLAGAYIVIGFNLDYRTVAAPMNEMCSEIESGMTSSEVKSIAAQYKGAGVMGATEGIQLSQVSNGVGHLREDWICICHVQMSLNSVSSVDEPFCSD